MKKIFTLIAMATMAIAASAQTSEGTVSFSTLVPKGDGLDNIAAITITADGTLAGSVALSDAVSATAQQATYKDLTGASTPFGDGVAYIKFQPTAADAISSGTGSTAADYSAYVDFTVEEGNTEKIFGDMKVEFDATRLGSDAVRLQAEILSIGDGEETTGNILTSDNWQTYADGESWAMFASTDGGEKDTPYEVGWTPIREDLSKGTNVAGSTTPYSHVTISNPKLAENAYSATLRIYVTGISNTKGFCIENVKFTFGSAAGINNVVAAKSENAVSYNAVGQRVNANTKGLVIRGGHKFMNK